MDLGGNQRGVDMGPSAIRLTDFVERLADLGIDIEDFGNVLVHTRAKVVEGSGNAHYLDEILRACRASAEMTEEVLAAGRIPVALGGDHTVAMGTIAGMAAKHKSPGGVIWIDAHADLNTPATSPSGNVHGMALAVALGLCDDDPSFAQRWWTSPMIDTKHCVLIATRDLDPGEREYLRGGNGPTVFTIEDIDRHGIMHVAKQAMEVVKGAPFLHVSVDLDALDPRDAPGVGTPVRGGLSYREAHALMESLSQLPFSSVDLVEVNPSLDMQNQTAELAGELICSLFGARIL